MAIIAVLLVLTATLFGQGETNAMRSIQNLRNTENVKNLEIIKQVETENKFIMDKRIANTGNCTYPTGCFQPCRPVVRATYYSCKAAMENPGANTRDMKHLNAKDVYHKYKKQASADCVYPPNCHPGCEATVADCYYSCMADAIATAVTVATVATVVTVAR